jgi:hypothetical protein
LFVETHGGRKQCVLGLIHTPKILKNMKIEFSVEIHSKWSAFWGKRTNHFFYCFGPSRDRPWNHAWFYWVRTWRLVSFYATKLGGAVSKRVFRFTFNESRTSYLTTVPTRAAFEQNGDLSGSYQTR